MSEFVIDYKPVGKNGTLHLAAVLDGEPIHADKVDLARASARDKFKKALLAHCPALDGAAVDRELLRIATESTRPPRPASTFLPELDVSAVVRPELFHRYEVSGVLIPVVILHAGEPAGRWQLYLRWHDGGGRRERCELTQQIQLPDGRQVWPHPIPAAPTPTTVSLWSGEGRRAWLAGADAPEAAEVFGRIQDVFRHYVDFPPEHADGNTATLGLWVLLTYCYPAWSAVPYLSIGGPLGSGKSRVFELLARLVFRPTVSANMTAPCMFRSLHEQGGVLLLDEAERLREGSPDAAELRSILLSGYKVGSPAKRTEPTTDGKFRQVSFDIYGPKAIAGISTLPEALASRCIRLTMFRSAPDSSTPRRRLDEDPDLWAGLRDDLHALALEHGRAWLELAGRADACPAMSGRDFELWQPLLALALWLEGQGAAGLVQLMRSHAARLIELNRDDATPDGDEILLRILTEAVIEGRADWMTPTDLLKTATERDAGIFGKWSTRGIGTTLKRYGVVPYKVHGRRTYRGITLCQLRRIQDAYGIDLGITGEILPPLPPQAPFAPHAPPDDPELAFPGPSEGMEDSDGGNW